MVTASQRMRVRDLLARKSVDVKWLALETGLEERIVDSIVRQQYTPSPEQRRYVAQALQADPDDILWGHAIEVEYLKDPV